MLVCHHCAGWAHWLLVLYWILIAWWFFVTSGEMYLAQINWLNLLDQVFHWQWYLVHLSTLGIGINRTFNLILYTGFIPLLPLASFQGNFGLHRQLILIPLPIMSNILIRESWIEPCNLIHLGIWFLFLFSLLFYIFPRKFKILQPFWIIDLKITVKDIKK